MSDPAVTVQPVVPGWFGKIPALGDFASRRLPEAFVAEWDHWLQEGLAQTRTDYGAQWQAIYLVAPILRFWLGPGTLDRQAWAGLMMPSADRVGRYFPLTLARPLPSLADALDAHAWYAALDAAARRVLDVQFTPEDLEAELWAVSQIEIERAGAAAESLAAALFARCGARAPCSVWWRELPGHRSDPAGFAGLPRADAFSAMLAART